MKFKAYGENTASQLHKPFSKAAYVNIWLLRDANNATLIMHCKRKLIGFVMVQQIAFVHVTNITLKGRIDWAVLVLLMLCVHSS
jgi:hypothetical protein